MIFLLLNWAEEEAIKVKSTPVRLEIVNHITNDLNRNMSEEVNVNDCKIFPVAHHFVCNDILHFTSRKHTSPICGKVVS